VVDVHTRGYAHGSETAVVTGAAESDPDLMARARTLLSRFLTDRPDRTLQAYTTDLDDFARFLSASPPAATARLLAGGPGVAHRVALDFAMELRRRGRAPATIDRRLNTLRALVRDAADSGIVDWHLPIPGPDEITAEMGRLPAIDSEHYLFPRHLGEVDRLDIQHYAIRDTLKGNYVAPIGDPAHILDVGSGTGQWGFEMSQSFDPALVVGLDLVSGKAGQPPHYRYVRGNVLHGLPFADDQFDYVHQRLMVAGLPISSWSSVVGDLARVTRPGGWVELVELRWEAEGSGPGVRRLGERMLTLLASSPIDTSDVVYRSLHTYLEEAGLRNVTRYEAAVPVGRWGGPVGTVMVTTVRSGVTRVCEVLQARGMLSAEEARDLIQGALADWEDGRMSYPVAVVYGQKPR
jgi:ubiquinone/menaquinone biosynthesis C-methylase UbiE